MWDKLYKPLDVIQTGISAAWTRNAVIRNNIANVETPNFKASDVEFESLMKSALEEGSYTGWKTQPGHIEGSFTGTVTNPKHIQIGSEKLSSLSSVEPLISKRENLSMRMDGNNVDIEDENVKLAQNSLYYNTLFEKLNSEIRRLRMAITEAR